MKVTCEYCESVVDADKNDTCPNCGAPLADSAFGYYFRSYLPVLIVAAIASTPLAATLWRKLPQRAAQALGTLAILAGLALCTAYLVAGTYNPFLYFRF